MSNIINQRSELLFCYDITDANPNGDPLDENKPRIDEETGFNFVTDVRLKRTIRDYLYTYKGFNGTGGRDIFVRPKFMKEGDEASGLQDGKTRAKDFDEQKNRVLNECIDVRLFGGVLPLKKDSITFTGPTQFKIGRSLHKVILKHIQGTGAFSSKPGNKQATFREEYVLPYSFIAFHGIINENAAKETGMTDEDERLLLEGIWNGTKNLISRSKFGQQPRLLVQVKYNTPGFFIGDLDKKISLDTEINDLKIRSTGDFKLDISKLNQAISQAGSQVDKVLYKADDGLQIAIPENWQTLEL